MVGMPGSVTETQQPLLSVGGRRLILSLLTFFGFLGALDQNVIVTTLPKMLGDTNVPIVLFTVGKSPAIQFDRAGWLVTGYLLGYVAVLPLMGAVSDVYGRRRTLQLALLVFALGSVIAALAGTLPVLVLARTGQALGAGALLPVSLAAAADLVGIRQQGRALGLIAAAAELGGVCGPLYGGFISQLSDLGWRLIFWLNVPIVLVLLPLTFLLPAGGSPRPVDYRGSLILGLALAALVAGTSSTASLAAPPWAAPPIASSCCSAWRCWRCSGGWSAQRPTHCCRWACSAPPSGRRLRRQPARRGGAGRGDRGGADLRGDGAGGLTGGWGTVAATLPGDADARRRAWRLAARPLRLTCGGLCRTGAGRRGLLAAPLLAGYPAPYAVVAAADAGRAGRRAGSGPGDHGGVANRRP